MLTWAAQKIMGDKCAGAYGLSSGKKRVPDAVRHSSCRSAEPGPYRTPAFVTIPVLRSKRVRKSYALHRARDTKLYLPRSFSSTSDDANPSAGVPIEA